MRGKAGLRRDGVVVPDPQRAPAHAIGVVIAREGEMVAGVEPAVVGMAQAVEFADVDHGLVLSSRGAEHRAAASRCSQDSDGDRFYTRVDRNLSFQFMRFYGASRFIRLGIFRRLLRPWQLYRFV